MSERRVPADVLRQFVERVFVCVGYPPDRAADAADVLMWASLRGVDSHGVRNLKRYYVDRTLSGELNPAAELHIERETPYAACLDGGSGLGLTSACRAMRLAIDKCRRAGVAMVVMRNTHHLGAAGFYAHMAAEQGLLGACMTGHFFGRGNSIGVAPVGGLAAMFSTNPLSFAAPCGRHPPFVLDMASSVATVNRIETYAQAGRPIPLGWAHDATGKPTTDPTAARLLLSLGGTPELGGQKGAGLAMMVSILSGVLSAAWAPLTGELTEGAMQQAGEYNQPTMGHFFVAVRINAFQPLERFRAAMDAMIDALHATPTADANQKVCYPGEIEFRTARERTELGIPLNDFVRHELNVLAEELGLEALPG